MRVVYWKKSRSNPGSRFRAELDCSHNLPVSAFMTLAQMRNLVIQVAIVCAPGTDVLADSIEELLAEAKVSDSRESSVTRNSALSRTRSALATLT